MAWTPPVARQGRGSRRRLGLGLAGWGVFQALKGRARTRLCLFTVRCVWAFPRRVRHLTALASGSQVKPEAPFQAFGILALLWAYCRAQDVAKTNRRLLLGAGIGQRVRTEGLGACGSDDPGADRQSFGSVALR
jgi:hypothetical protein